MMFRCSICGYIYDEAKEEVPFADLPEDWQCPLCGAPKSAFEPYEEITVVPAVTHMGIADSTGEESDASMLRLSVGQMAALCSNFSRGCEKQYMPGEAALFKKLADWFSAHSPKESDATVERVESLLKENIADYAEANRVSVQHGDRGALRVLSWGEKATRMLNSLMARYQREGDALLADVDIWVCSVCGFVYIGKAAPEFCPICKVPSWKFNLTEKRK